MNKGLLFLFFVGSFFLLLLEILMKNCSNFYSLFPKDAAKNFKGMERYGLTEEREDIMNLSKCVKIQKCKQGCGIRRSCGHSFGIPGGRGWF
jgi:hypothetical protein